jgi:hypothetical protein
LSFSGLILECILRCFWAARAEKRPKTRLKKIEGERRQEKSFFSLNFFGQKLLTRLDFPQKVFYGVFELPLLRNAQKRHKKSQNFN